MLIEEAAPTYESWRSARSKPVDYRAWLEASHESHHLQTSPGGGPIRPVS
jgi:hypothetical protein